MGSLFYSPAFHIASVTAGWSESLDSQAACPTGDLYYTTCVTSYSARLDCRLDRCSHYSLSDPSPAL